jgi:thioredoxin reductase (NADPH)
MGDRRVVLTEGGEFDARAVIIATGSKHRQLGLPGEEELVGNGISYCAVCDGAFYKDKHVAVIGGGNSALQDAVMLSDICKKVTIVQNLPYLTGEERLQNFLAGKNNVEVITNKTVATLIGEDRLTSINIKDETSGVITNLKIDGMFVAIGQIPENQPFATITKLNEYGYIASDESCVTDDPAVFVAGDCRSKRIRQITTATADGAVAALAACRYIDK